MLVTIPAFRQVIIKKPCTVFLFYNAWKSLIPVHKMRYVRRELWYPSCVADKTQRIRISYVYCSSLNLTNNWYYMKASLQCNCVPFSTPKGPSTRGWSVCSAWMISLCWSTLDDHLSTFTLVQVFCIRQKHSAHLIEGNIKFLQKCLTRSGFFSFQQPLSWFLDLTDSRCDLV